MFAVNIDWSQRRPNGCKSGSRDHKRDINKHVSSSYGCNIPYICKQVRPAESRSRVSIATGKGHRPTARSPSQSLLNGSWREFLWNAYFFLRLSFCSLQLCVWVFYESSFNSAKLWEKCIMTGRAMLEREQCAWLHYKSLLGYCTKKRQI